MRTFRLELCLLVLDLLATRQDLVLLELHGGLVLAQVLRLGPDARLGLLDAQAQSTHRLYLVVVLQTQLLELRICTRRPLSITCTHSTILIDSLSTSASLDVLMYLDIWSTQSRSIAHATDFDWLATLSRLMLSRFFRELLRRTIGR